MSQIQRAWDVIPATAKAIAFLAWLGLAILIRFVFFPADREANKWLEWQKDVFSFCIPLVFLLYVLLVGYVYGDAKRRFMRHVLWTLIAALMPYAIGAIIYFVIRNPLPATCPSCQTDARPGFAYCAKCGTRLTRSCEGCGRSVEAEWTNCPYCGKKLGAGAAGNS